MFKSIRGRPIFVFNSPDILQNPGPPNGAMEHGNNADTDTFPPQGDNIQSNAPYPPGHQARPHQVKHTEWRMGTLLIG